MVGAPGTIPKGSEKRQEDKEIRGQLETIQTKALSKSAWMLRRVLNSNEKPSANAGVKNSHRSK